MLWAFIPIAAIVTVTPGATTAMVVRSAVSGGIGSGIRAIAGNEIGVLTWAMLSVAGVSALWRSSSAERERRSGTGASAMFSGTAE